jgi:hypothetical protein
MRTRNPKREIRMESEIRNPKHEIRNKFEIRNSGPEANAPRLATPLLLILLLATLQPARATDDPLLLDPETPAVNGTVHALARLGQWIYVGGEFSEIGGVARRNLAVFNSKTGEIDPHWAPEPNAPVRALDTITATVFVGGEFTEIGGAAHRGVAALESQGIEFGGDPHTGRLVEGWSIEAADGAVQALAHDAQYLYIGGSFTTIGGLGRNRLAAVRLGIGSFAIESFWNPDIDGVGPVTVRAIVAGPSRIYAGGSFIDTVNGGAVARRNLAAFEAPGNARTGEAIAGFASPLPPGGEIYAMTTDGAYLYIGGAFAGLTGELGGRGALAALPLAEVGGDGSADQQWRPTAQIANSIDPATINALEAADGRIWVGGRFDQFNADPGATGGVAVEPAGSQRTGALQTRWQPRLEGIPNGLPEVRAIRFADPGVYAGGTFRLDDPTTQTHLAGWGTPGLEQKNAIGAGTWGHYR